MMRDVVMFAAGAAAGVSAVVAAVWATMRAVEAVDDAIVAAHDEAAGAPAREGRPW